MIHAWKDAVMYRNKIIHKIQRLTKQSKKYCKKNIYYQLHEINKILNVGEWCNGRNLAATSSLVFFSNEPLPSFNQAARVTIKKDKH